MTGPSVLRDRFYVYATLILGEIFAWVGAWATIDGGLTEGRALYWLSGLAMGMAVAIHRAAQLEDQKYWVTERETFRKMQLVDRDTFGGWRRL